MQTLKIVWKSEQIRYLASFMKRGGRLVQKILTSKKLVIRYSQTSVGVGGGITFKFTVHFGGQLHGKSIFYVYI